MVGQKPAIEPNAVYSREEVAELLGVSLSTLKRIITEGHLKVTRLRGMRRIFITGSSILAMLEQSAPRKETRKRSANT